MNNFCNILLALTLLLYLSYPILSWLILGVGTLLQRRWKLKDLRPKRQRFTTKH